MAVSELIMQAVTNINKPTGRYSGAGQWSHYINIHCIIMLTYNCSCLMFLVHVARIYIHAEASLDCHNISLIRVN